MNNHLDKNLFNELCQKFQIVDIIDSIYYDKSNGLENLEQKIKQFENIRFEPTQRILVYYHDTGFYKNLSSGSSVFFWNLVQLFKKFNVPPEFIIIVTNHYGIKKEIDYLDSIFNYSINKIIETFLWYDFANPTVVRETNVSNKKEKRNFLYTCLNSRVRTHRVLTLCYLNEKKLLEKGIVSYRFKNE